MRLIIDRFEGEFAVIEAEDGSIFNIPKKLLACCKEGDVLKCEFDEEETKRRNAVAKKLTEDLFR